jgi:two-component system sensor histidine kinase AlgZ
MTALVFTLGLRYRRLLMQPSQASTRLAVLQSRIRPHFLFNTLNTAIALVRIDPLRAESVLEDLSDLFRAALVDADSEPALESSLAEELALGRRYLAIEQVRFGERLRVHWDLDPSAEGARLPHLLLQPLLENAVRHGVEPSSDIASVHIQTRREAGLVSLIITNPLPSEASVPGHRMALDNLRERLVLMHGVACDFRAGRNGDRYRVAIQVPA